MCPDGHQGSNHAQGHRNSPEPWFAKTDGLHRLTQPILVMNKISGHACIGSRDCREKEEERQIIFNGQERE